MSVVFISWSMEVGGCNNDEEEELVELKKNEYQVRIDTLFSDSEKEALTSKISKMDWTNFQNDAPSTKSKQIAIASVLTTSEISWEDT